MGGKMVLGKGGRKAKRKWDSGWFLSRGGIFLKKESTVGLLNGAFFCFFRGGYGGRRGLGREKAVRRAKG